MVSRLPCDVEPRPIAENRKFFSYERLFFMTKRKEQRKRQRLQVPKDVFIGVGPHFTRVGRLRDLSMDGLAFRYVGNSKPSSGSYVDIFTLEGDFFLDKLPIKIISDVEIVEKAPSSSVTTRRCSVKFGNLTLLQKAELERFAKSKECVVRKSRILAKEKESWK